MAVERSHARLGLFLVVALVVVARHGAALHSTGEEPCGDRDGHLHDGERQRPRRLEPGAVQGRAAGPRHRVARGPAIEHHRDRLRGVSRPAEHRWRERRADPARPPISRACSPSFAPRSIGNPVTGEAYLLLDAPENPPPPMALGFTPDRAYIPSMPTPLAAIRDRRAGGARARGSHAAGARETSSPGFRTASTGATASSPTSSASFRRAICRR